VQSLKIKLGAPEGLEADRAMFEQVIKSTQNYDVKIRVDANGGWTLNQALEMIPWLAERKVDYVEQPLKEGDEANLPELFSKTVLPIYVDESCRSAQDIPKWAHAVHGVNMKLMKCGGISGALEIIATAKAFGLKTMIGCMSESSIAIAASAALSGVLDHVDLDAHYNLTVDPLASGQGTRVYDLTRGSSKPLPLFSGWDGERLKTAEYLSLYPNVLLGIQADHFFVILLMPESVDQTRERLQFLYSDKDAVTAAYLERRQSLHEAWSVVFAEDISVVEGMQSGRASPAFTGGLFTPLMDVPTHHFHQWFFAQQREENAPGVPTPVK
ncbi:MAG: hypothetical protein EBY45_10210, partial [Gammaproteobacteria bacterium]|nr:hypothetical protein [Gammaproteobacteria bacterium]